MTYLIENEQAALHRAGPLPRPGAPALPRGRAAPRGPGGRRGAPHRGVHPARALLHGAELGVSRAGGRASLQTLLDEPDFALATFLLSVLGEGTFLDLLAFLERHAPDPVTAQVARLALQDEARHVAFGLAHLEHHGRRRPGAARPAARSRSSAATTRCATPPGSTPTSSTRSSCSPPAAGTPTRSRAGTSAVQTLAAEMDEGRRRRLVRLGFSADEAAELSALHTRNFM